MIRQNDVIAIAKHAYKSGREDAGKPVLDDEDISSIEDMVKEALADCESYNENLH